MRLKTESFELNGTKYTTTEYGAFRALETLARLTKTVGPALGALGGMSADTDLMKAAPALLGALMHVDAAVFPTLVVDVLGGTTALITGPDGQPQVVTLGDKVAIDRVFSGALGDMFKVVIHALKVNYSDFFGGG